MILVYFLLSVWFHCENFEYIDCFWGKNGKEKNESANYFELSKLKCNDKCQNI